MAKHRHNIPQRTGQPPNSGQAKPPVVTQQSIEWSGPIPPPAALEHVDRVVPGGADRILRMAEQEQAHRIEMQKIHIGAEITDTKRGQILGACVAGAAIVGATFSVYFNAPWQVACAFLGVPILGVVSALIHGRRRSS